MDGIEGAIKTGLTMTGTTLGAVTSLYIFSTMSGISVLSQISLILMVGLVGDIIATWFTNATIIMWYLERKNANK